MQVNVSTAAPVIVTLPRDEASRMAEAGADNAKLFAQDWVGPVLSTLQSITIVTRLTRW